MTSKSTYKLPEDAVWFITGCSSGIGLALASLIAAHPTHRLVATARDPSKLASLKTSPRVHTVSLDVTDSASISSALDSALAAFGRIDVLVNNAGYGLMGDTESALQPDDEAKARKVVETDFWGTATLSLHAIRIFRDENPRTGQQGGVVLNVTSIGGFAGFPGSAFYHAAKFGVEGFTESLSKEVRPEWNIHFSLIEPGGTKSDFVTGSMGWLSRHPAYASPDTPTRLLEGYILNPDSQKTFTSAENMAAGMYRVAASGDIPLRAPLSEAAWTVLKTECELVSKELDGVKELCLSVDNSGTNESGAFLRSTF
ncbi:short-chain dehydrogenase/reductase-like protein SDR [Stachybotrys elegans]|uniref:Short-chain dehydrogenase/reductase-like protein SDR n=1 Tax=Stachybotrys elegans TaxID=80388 RepID=A0A8K0T3P8_9HYPO|nr:short-chain dehydrogenase/reductase-like protein SDR [Stachybotrys elegans]